MLDNKIKNEIKNLLLKLDGDVRIIINKSTHPDFSSLQKLLLEVSDLSSYITLEEGREEDLPSFEIGSTKFIGVPNGHEFSSLILGILNSNEKGKMPDNNTIKRIKDIGEVTLTTYISLTCLNCPDVVQQINLMSFINPKIKHVIKDGQYFSEELNELGIQGVPSVTHKNNLILSGKTSLNKILTQIEDLLFIEKKSVKLEDYDVAVIGGGPAGISSAIYSARKGLKTILIAEKVGGQVSDTKGIENLISTPYIEGKELGKNLLSHLEQYDIDLLEDRLVSSISDKILLNTGEYFYSKSVIIATGAKWKKLNIKGENEYLGKGVAFCPHCDGHFYRNKNVVVVGGGNSGVEAAIDLSKIVKKVTIIEYAEIKADDFLIKKLSSISNIKIIDHAETKEINGSEVVESLTYQDRKTEEIKIIKTDGIFVQIGLSPNSDFINNLKLNSKKEIIINDRNETSVKGIFAAGDVTTVPYKQIVISIGEGAKAALSAFEFLTFSDLSSST